MAFDSKSKFDKNPSQGYLKDLKPPQHPDPQQRNSSQFLREALSEQKIKELKSLISMDKKTPALPVIKHVKLETVKKNQHKRNSSQASLHTYQHQDLDPSQYLQSSNRFDTYDPHSVKTQSKARPTMEVNIMQHLKPMQQLQTTEGGLNSLSLRNSSLKSSGINLHHEVAQESQDQVNSIIEVENDHAKETARKVNEGEEQGEESDEELTHIEESYNLLRKGESRNQERQESQVRVVQQLLPPAQRELLELKEKLLAYKIDVDKLLKESQVSRAQEHQMSNRIDFSSIMLSKKSLRGSQSQKSLHQNEPLMLVNRDQTLTQEMKLPQLNISKHKQQTKIELDKQRLRVGKLIQDKDYILSMEYLKGDDLAMLSNRGGFHSVKGLKDSLMTPMSQSSMLTCSASLKDLKHQPLKKGGHLKPLQQMTTLLHRPNLNHQHTLSQPQVSPLKVTKAYQQHLDSKRDSQHDESPLKHLGILSAHHHQKPKSQAEVNLLRQKLNSSNGRKHFIVAYNLTETLVDNKMELECTDYKKIKEIINHISKQRFEGRHNNIEVKPTLKMIKSPEELEMTIQKLKHR